MTYRVGLGWWFLLVCWLGACGDDVRPGNDAGGGADRDAEVDAAGGHGGTHHLSDAGGDRDAGPTGGQPDAAMIVLGAEGALCAATPDCDGELVCVVAQVGSISVGVCARACVTAETCEDDELCYAYTKSPADAHCVNVVTETYALCGAGDTSRCDGHTCLYLPNSTLGLCVDLCALDPGGGDDAGAPDPGPGCTGGQTCIAGVVDSGMEGLCGIEIDRGDACAPEEGKFCAHGDGCTADKAGEPFGERHCRQDCSANGKCASGTHCEGVVGQTAYCYSGAG